MSTHGAPKEPPREPPKPPATKGERRRWLAAQKVKSSAPADNSANAS